MYDVDAALPIDSLPAGSNVLVAGPPLTGKRAIAYDLLAGGCAGDDGAILVTTLESADRLRRNYPALDAAVGEGRAGIVDCVTRQRGDDVDDEAGVKYVGTPSDVTDIGIRTGGFFQQLREGDADEARVALVSLSTMLMYTDVRRVFRFAHVLTGRVTAADWLGVAVAGARDSEAVNRLAPLFDGAVQTRESDDGVEVRFVGLGRGRSEWVPY